MRAVVALGLSVWLGMSACRAGAVQGEEGRTGPFLVRLTMRKQVIDPSDGVMFEYLLKNVSKEAVACNLRAALDSFHFVFSPVGPGGKRVVCRGPFGGGVREALTKVAIGHGLNATSRLSFPRDLLPGSSSDRDYPTPPPGEYDLTAVLPFPKHAEGWSGTVATPPVRVTVVLSKKRKANLAARAPFSREETLVLNALRQRLQKVLETAAPRVTVAFEGHTLVAKCRTRRFSVHAIDKTGAIASAPDSELGPDHKGFLMKAWVEPAATPRAADPPQDVRRPYWTTHLNAHAIGKEHVLRLSLSYGSQADRAALEAIKRAAAEATK